MASMCLDIRLQCNSIHIIHQYIFIVNQYINIVVLTILKLGTKAGRLIVKLDATL